MLTGIYKHTSAISTLHSPGIEEEGKGGMKEEEARQGRQKGLENCQESKRWEVCVYYCRTYYKAVCGGGGGQ